MSDLKKFWKSAEPETEYLQKYMSNAVKFQNAGIALVVLAILIHLIGGPKLYTLSYLILLPGALSLVFGGSSLQPHNLIKSFAQQCSREPDDKIAESLLETITRNKKIALTKNSIQIVNLAIEIYANDPDAKPELTEQLREAVKTHITKKFF